MVLLAFPFHLVGLRCGGCSPFLGCRAGGFRQTCLAFGEQAFTPYAFPPKVYTGHQANDIAAKSRLPGRRNLKPHTFRLRLFSARPTLIRAFF